MSSERKRLYAVIIIIVFGFIIITGIGNFRAKQLAVEIAGNQVTQTVAVAAEGLEAEQIMKIAEASDENDPVYMDVRKKLISLKNEHNLENIYLLYRDQDLLWTHIVDTKDDNDPAHKLPGTEEKQVSGPVEKTIRGNAVEGIYNTTSKGPLVSSYKEIKDSKGNIIAVLGGDFAAEEFTGFLYTTIHAQIGLAALCLFLIGGLMLVTRNK